MRDESRKPAFLPGTRYGLPLALTLAALLIAALGGTAMASAMAIALAGAALVVLVSTFAARAGVAGDGGGRRTRPTWF